VRDVPARVSVVTLGARDVSALKTFYRGLGWPETPVSGEPYASFRTAGALLGLFPADALADDANADADRLGFTLTVMVDSPAEVDEVLEAAAAAGATIVREPRDAFGGRSGYFADPEGNRWEVAYLPHTTFDATGGVAIHAPPD
jgi:catechol 2,3-dioxygenase-like lactoylglutathione lyase family enzyme